MEGRPPKPRVGDLVMVAGDYPNTNARGQVCLVVDTFGISCEVEPVTSQYGTPWTFERRWLEIINEDR